MKFNIFLLFLILLPFTIKAQTYKAIYKIEFASNLLNLTHIKKERAILMIDGNTQSTFTTENVYKQDSLKKLIEKGQINAHELMNDKYPRSSFKHFVDKKYETQDMRISNVLVVDNYIYNQKNELNWQLFSDTLKIKNYVCNKATTSNEGRKYTAWYTPEIPISDGPYKFWGLPGLILKIYDSENHYTFTLESFEKYEGKQYDIPFGTIKSFEVSYDEFKQKSQEVTENPRKAFELERNMRITSIDGKSPSLSPSTTKPNFIGRF